GEGTPIRSGESDRRADDRSRTVADQCAPASVDASDFDAYVASGVACGFVEPSETPPSAPSITASSFVSKAAADALSCTRAAIEKPSATNASLTRVLFMGSPWVGCSRSQAKQRAHASRRGGGRGRSFRCARTLGAEALPSAWTGAFAL